MKLLAPTALVVLVAALGCNSPTTRTESPANVPADDVPWAAAPLADSVVVFDKERRRLDLATLYDELARADIVFLGETHIDETTHRVELGVYRELIDRRGDVVLGLEMFERDAQGVLDAYLTGELDEPGFLHRSNPWSNYRTSYRPLVELAREHGLPVVASNFPRALRMRVAREGLTVLDALSPEERGQAPLELHPNTPEYWRRTDNAVRGHLAMMGGPRDPDDPRLDATQTLWDNAMGEAAAFAHRDHPGALVLHVNGGFHSAHWDGTVHQCRLRAPDADIKTVEIVPAQVAALARPGPIPDADYLVFTQRGAQDLNEGQYAYYAQRPVRYRLHLPKSASDEHPVPLLLFLCDDGLSSEDALALWKERLGDECAIAAFDPPYREVLADQSPGGRWFWVETYDEDSSTARTGVEGAYGYLLRHFPIDPEHVCLAGEGTGATLAAEEALLTDTIDASVVALEPRRYAKLKDNPLPLPEDSGPRTARSLEVWTGERDASWWDGELEAYASIGLATERRAVSEDPFAVELERENALRAGLGLGERAAPVGARGYVEVPDDSVRAELWARQRALRALLEEDRLVAVLPTGADTSVVGDAERLSLDVDRAAVLEGKGLPVCPGPFGGTTVLVVPAADLDAWLPIEDADPLKKRSRFLRTRVAVAGEAGGERALEVVLSKLLGENRKNVLVVPAAFHASGETMRALVKSVASLDDRMTLHWLPGLGAP